MSSSEEEESGSQEDEEEEEEEEEEGSDEGSEDESQAKSKQSSQKVQFKAEPLMSWNELQISAQQLRNKIENYTNQLSYNQAGGFYQQNFQSNPNQYNYMNHPWNNNPNYGVKNPMDNPMYHSQTPNYIQFGGQNNYNNGSQFNNYPQNKSLYGQIQEPHRPMLNNNIMRQNQDQQIQTGFESTPQNNNIQQGSQQNQEQQLMRQSSQMAIQAVQDYKLKLRNSSQNALEAIQDYRIQKNFQENNLQSSQIQTEAPQIHQETRIRAPKIAPPMNYQSWKHQGQNELLSRFHNTSNTPFRVSGKYY